jgi:hypothetical protein
MTIKLNVSTFVGLAARAASDCVSGYRIYCFCSRLGRSKKVLAGPVPGVDLMQIKHNGGHAWLISREFPPQIDLRKFIWIRTQASTTCTRIWAVELTHGEICVHACIGLRDSD